MTPDPKQNRLSTNQSETNTEKLSLSTASTLTLKNDDQLDDIDYSHHLRTNSLATKKTPWTSIKITASLAFCSAIQFSLYVSSTFPYLQTLDSTTTERFFGLVVSSYSLGQIVGAPVFGWWSNKIENVRKPVTACLMCSFTGNFIYIIAQMFPQNSSYLILLARFVVGIGAGNISILKSYVSMASSAEDRSRAIAMVTGGIAVGSMCGPAIQLLFTPIGYPGFKIFDGLLLNVYTAPAFGACLINIVGICFLYGLFVEEYAGIINTKKTSDEKQENKLPKYDIIAILVCHLTIFCQRFTYTNIETLGAPIAQSIFAWNKAQIVFYIGLAHSCVSFCALIINFIFVTFKMEKILNFRLHCVCAIIGLMMFHLVTFNWPFLSGSLKTYSQAEYDAGVLNGTEIVGCNRDRFSWCEETKSMNIWLYYSSYVLFFGMCFPSINITLNTLFSKIIGPRRMAAAQGLLQMTGSFARLTGPLLISNMYSSFGLRFSWTLELIVLTIVILFWLKFYNRMVPLNMEKDNLSIRSKVTLVYTTKPVEKNNNVLKISAL